MMFRLNGYLALVVLALLAASWDLRAESPPGQERAGDFEREAVGSPADPFLHTVRPLLERYCIDCHGEVGAEGELNLAVFEDSQRVLQGPEIWQQVWSKLHRQEMPPHEPLPAPEERERLLAAIAELLDRAFAAAGRRPGEVVIRRLNQFEYNNTVLDLFGSGRSMRYFDPARGMPEKARSVMHQSSHRIVVPLPPDPAGDGFSNLGQTLSLPPFLMEKYLTAAGDVVRQLASPRMFRSGEDDSQPRVPARRQIAAFGARAFRRPLTDEEIDRYLALYDLAIEVGHRQEDALKVPVEAMLVSPHFLFRVERGVAGEERDGLRPLSDHELAARLSYFLWSSMPDEELFHLAESGRLRDAEVLEEQTLRMLRHRFSKELSQQFGLQWLQLTGIRSAMPFPDLYPRFYRPRYVPEAMQQEAMLLFETIMVEDRSLLDFIDPGFTWLNGALNEFYGLHPEHAKPRKGIHFFHDFFRYELADKRRGGILTMAGPLLATSLPTRTSPVNRGKWILETILGAPPPPPPPNVADLDDTPVAEDHLSLRQRLERHRADPACASCHRRMDPLGFGLENYDAIGLWRDRLDGEPIDGEGALTDGTLFHGPVGLKQLVLEKHRDDFLRCLVEKMMTYAVGRKLEYFDAPAVAEIVDQLHRDEYRFSTLVVGVVRSQPFRYMIAPDSNEERNEP